MVILRRARLGTHLLTHVKRMVTSYGLVAGWPTSDDRAMKLEEVARELERLSRLTFDGWNESDVREDCSLSCPSSG